jgi:NAD-dependent SIR2 family protein deacetylase
MIGELMVGAGTAAAAGFAYARRRRAGLYRDLEAHVARIVAAPAPNLGDLAQRKPPRFADRFAVVLAAGPNLCVPQGGS